MTPGLWFLAFVALWWVALRWPAVLGWKNTKLPGTQGSFSVCFYAGSAVTHTNIGSAFAEFNASSNRRHSADLTGYRQARVIFCGGVNGNAGSLGVVRMSVDGGTVFTLMASCPLDAIVTNVVGGAWTDIPVAMRTDGILQFGTQAGDGAADPTISGARIDFRR